PILPSSVRPVGSPASSTQVSEPGLLSPLTVGDCTAAKLSEIACAPLVNDRPVLEAVSPLPPGVEPEGRSDSLTSSDAVPSNLRTVRGVFCGGLVSLNGGGEPGFSGGGVKGVPPFGPPAVCTGPVKSPPDDPALCPGTVPVVRGSACPARYV